VVVIKIMLRQHPQFYRQHILLPLSPAVNIYWRKRHVNGA